MGFLSKALFGGAAERELKGSEATLELFKQVFGSNASATGDKINWKTALQVSTALACTRSIANGISQVPLKLFEESADGRSRQPAKNHPMYRLLHRKPNLWQTSFEYRQTLGFHLVLCGNHFSFKNIVDGKLVELLPLEPGRMCVERYELGDIEYTYTFDSGKKQTLPASAIWHVRGPSWNGWMGMEAVQLAREAIGLAMATERQHAKQHAQGVSTSGVYSVEGTLDDKQYKQLRNFIKENYSGSENSGLPMILDRNAKWLSQAMTGVDAQHLETRRFQVEEVCRAMGVMPIMVGYSDKTATYASAEQMFLAHVVHTLSPWYECIEQSIDVNLLTERDYRNGIYAKFIEEGLLRGALKDTAEYLTKLTDRGVMTRNEARAKLDLNPLDGLDKPLTPANLMGDPEDVPDPDKQPA